MNGAGNDFVVIDNRFFAFSPDELSRLAQRLCPRNTSVGADGLLALETRNIEEGIDFRMRYYNADGSCGSMCGNGARCLVRFAVDAGVVKQSTCKFLTDAGAYTADILSNGDIRLFLPEPTRLRRTSVRVPDSGEEPATFVWTGTEHVVCYVADLDSFPVNTHGPALRRKPEFGVNGANVNFVRVLDPLGTISVRTFEKGVEAETLACGTGAVASAVVSFLDGRTTSTKTTVNMRGGKLTVGFETADGQIRNVYLEGPATTVFRGSCPIDLKAT